MIWWGVLLVVVGSLAVAIALFLVAIKIYKSTFGVCKSKHRLEGKTALVTGANTGIGLETAKDLARRGARVLLACRDPERGRRAVELVRAVATGNAGIELLSLDLESLASVRACARQVNETEPRLDILINNAGASGLGSGPTEDGLHRGLQVNHLGPFLFTLLLVDLVKRSAPSRIVFVSSVLHKYTSLTPEMFNYVNAKGILDGKIYCMSKLANILNANELARRLKDSGVAVNSLHPGVVRTEINRHMSMWLNAPITCMLNPFYKSAAEGAQTTIHVAVCERIEGVSGRYFSDCKETRTSREGADEELARAIWTKSERLVSFKEEERHVF